jgi:hypothetical protein
MSDKPDWDSAPEEATHWDSDAEYFCHNKGWWLDCGQYVKDEYQSAWGTSRYNERPDNWPSERERLQNKPSWEGAPDWANYLYFKNGEKAWMPLPLKKISGTIGGEWKIIATRAKPEPIVTSRKESNAACSGSVSQTVSYCDCPDPTQCWESCGELGNDEQYVQRSGELEYTGSSVSYYTVSVTNPTNQDAEPYEAECNDIIEALGMTYSEGNAFKAIWRRCAARTLGKTKKGYTDGLYDAEKAHFFTGRILEQECNK